MTRRTLVLVTAAALSASLAACGQRPPLNVLQDEESITIDLQSLGEYPSDVARLRIIDLSQDQVVWDVKGSDEPQLGRIRLKVGENSVLPTDVRHGTYEVIAPFGEGVFTLAPGALYLVEAWGSDSNPRTRHAAEFATPQLVQ